MDESRPWLKLPPDILWLAKEEDGLLHLFQGRVVEKFRWTALGHNDDGRVVVADPSAARSLAGIQRRRGLLLRRRSDSEVLLGRRRAWRGPGE